jgi:site-specific DNA recombinase
MRWSSCDGEGWLMLAFFPVRKKKLHYYKCQKCKGVSINSNTSRIKFPDNKGAHELFVSLLESYKLSPGMMDPFRFQVEKILNSYVDSSKSETSIYKKQLSELKNKKEILEERYGFGDIEKETYGKLSRKVNQEIQELEGKFDFSENEISNLPNELDRIIDFSQNISKYWVSGSLDTKKRIQKILFPDGLVLDTQHRQYLTSKVNSLFSLKRDFMRTSGDIKEKLPIKNDEESSLVAEGGFEPPTFGL